LRGHGHCLMKLGRHDASFDRIGLNFAHEALVAIYLWYFGLELQALAFAPRKSAPHRRLLDRFKSPPDGCEACVTPIGGPCPRFDPGGGYSIEGLYGAESARMPGIPRAVRADWKALL